jgi:hypothetical protein
MQESRRCLRWIVFTTKSAVQAHQYTYTHTATAQQQQLTLRWIRVQASTWSGARVHSHHFTHHQTHSSTPSNARKHVHHHVQTEKTHATKVGGWIRSLKAQITPIFGDTSAQLFRWLEHGPQLPFRYTHTCRERERERQSHKRISRTHTYTHTHTATTTTTTTITIT